ncbi:MAG: hypothetical protein COV31_03000 [Candidatus Yanofskybacteria bacterium CG10_big_fil_rev_8_21_14_0_10_46_23]|uniref:LTD domain-containing protein n=1 Tax=Candidatus Yanofskybacteria bacterium CG10_big_fil_rev_8_21_14_0_10_46_23 TaxID=1975098 RepID=A0A2H0R4X5_9BACT|nr:MAG: hypothetical protein COV31_03000 [Candidatus Yanofskybacteria bacterium CG10_big_fil_rev_8_21_14_0_10_46_23]
MKKKIILSFLTLLALPLISQAKVFETPLLKSAFGQNLFCRVMTNQHLLNLPARCLSVEPEPNPEPDGKLLITEVYYDVDSTHGTEADNEWVELYNGTDQIINLKDWQIADSSLTDTLPELLLASGQYALITKSGSTAGFWGWPGETLLIILNNPIGNGLSNSGDALYLKNPIGEVVDSLSWGANSAVFDPSLPGVIEGHSLGRIDPKIDTDTIADWQDQTLPDPGF